MLWAGFAAGGCGLLPKGKRGAAQAGVPAKPERAGTVVLVNEESGFVMVKAAGGRIPAPGAGLKTFSDGVETGEVRAGTERRKDFFTADIVAGQPARGDAVFRVPGGER